MLVNKLFPNYQQLKINHMKLFTLPILILAGLITGSCTDSVSEQPTRFLSDAEADLRLSSRSTAITPEYPINIDCDEWKEMTTHDEKVAFLELSNDVYKSMATDELACLCMAYPLNIDAYAFDDLATGLKRVISNAGCYQELMMREDSAEGIVKALKAHDVPVYLQSSVSLVDKYTLLIDCNLLMQMLQFPEVSSTFTPDEASEAASYLYYLAKVEREVLISDSHSVMSPLMACEACLRPGTDISDIKGITLTQNPSETMFARLKTHNIKPFKL